VSGPEPRAARSGDRQRISLAEAGALLVGTAIGSLLYRVVVEVLLAVDAVDKKSGYDNAAVRDSVLRFGPWAALVTGGGLLWWAARHGEHPTRRVVGGAALLGAGIAVFAWSALDMHGLGLYDWRSGSPAGVLDIAYHGAGVLVAIVGYALLTAPARGDAQ
jgi:uncharacterized membrane protein